MSLFNSTSELLPGLSQGAFRGVKFEIVNAEHETGRRIVTHFFPGVDLQAREDQGRLDGPVKVIGLVVGDDYVERARALEAALAQPGPGTLMHPWLGEMRVVVPAGARIKFSTGELRVARFDIIFEREGGGLVGGLISSSRLASALGGLRTASGALVAAALSSRTAPVNALDAAFEINTGLFETGIASAARLVNGTSLASSLSSALREAQAAPTAAAVSGLAPQLATLIGNASRPRVRPAIAIGSLTRSPVEPVDAGAAARLSLDLADHASRATVLVLPEQAAQAAMQAALVSAAVEAAVRIEFEAREAAYGWRADLDAAIVASISLTGALTFSLPGPAAGLTVALRDTRSALFTDLNEIIGRLPRTVVVRGGLSALMLAYDLKGDTPSAVTDYAAEIVRRNRLAHPAITPLTGVEVLK